MTDASINIAARIKETRIKAGLSQKDLADKLGITQTRLSNWEVGISRPSADNIFQLSDALDESADYLLGLTNIPRIDDSNLSNINNQDLKSLCDKLHDICLSLTEEGQNRVLGYAQALLDNDDYKKGIQDFNQQKVG